MNCHEIMTRNPSCCLSTDTVEKAAQLMKTEDVGSVPIIKDESSRTLTGIVTDRDLAIKVLADGRDPRNTKIQDVMTSGVFSCRPEDDVEKALNAMEEHQVRRIPIADKDDRIVGIIAQADIATKLQKPQKTAQVVEEVSKAASGG